MLRLFAASVATLAAILPATAAIAQNYPSRPVKIVVPYTAGGSSDFTARTLAEKLGPLLGGQVVVENCELRDTPRHGRHIARQRSAMAAPARHGSQQFP